MNGVIYFTAPAFNRLVVIEYKLPFLSVLSVFLDRLFHHAQTAVIEGKGYWMKEQLET